MLTLWGLYPIITLASDRDDKHNRIPGCGSAWLERLIWDQEVAGSNPVTPTILNWVACPVFLMSYLVGKISFKSQYPSSRNIILYCKVDNIDCDFGDTIV